MSRWSRFYWKHDRLRRSLNFLRVARVQLLTGLCFLILGFGVSRYSRWEVNRLADGYAKGYHEAMARASSLSDQLRTALEEQRVLRRERDECRARNP